MYANKTILVTGSSSGLGHKIALEYAKQGGRIIQIARDKSRLQEVDTELTKNNNMQNIWYSADVSKYSAIQDVNKELIKCDIVPDVVINNAAGNFLCPFSKLSENGWRSGRYCPKWSF